MKFVGASIFVCLVFCFCHCGYRLKHRLQDAFHSSKGIFVPVFDNLTDQVGAEKVFTNALILELASRREMVLSMEKKGALELRGVIRSINYDATAFSEAGFGGLQSYRRIPSEIRIVVGLSFSLSDPNTNRVVWSKKFTTTRRVDAPVDRTYDYESPSAIGMTTQSIIRSLYPAIARDIMRDVYDEMVELF